MSARPVCLFIPRGLCAGINALGQLGLTHRCLHLHCRRPPTPADARRLSLSTPLEEFRATGVGTLASVSLIMPNCAR